jgi:hypothetical protein
MILLIILHVSWGAVKNIIYTMLISIQFPPLSPSGTNMLDSQSPLSSTVIDVALQKIFCAFPITCNKNRYEHLEKSLKMRHMFFYIVNNHVIIKMIFISKTYGNQRLSPLMLWVRISIRAKCTTLCDKVCQWLATCRWFSLCPPVSSTNKQ